MTKIAPCKYVYDGVCLKDFIQKIGSCDSLDELDDEEEEIISSKDKIEDFGQLGCL